MGDVFFFYVLYKFDAVFDGCVILECYVGMFGASLKSEYDPKGEDAMTERIVVLVENGLIW